MLVPLCHARGVQGEYHQLWDYAWLALEPSHPPSIKDMNHFSVFPKSPILRACRQQSMDCWVMSKEN
ncbi:unnamed protein product [Nezara viridula]|uniref:Uncharacterized protein n=1 Tax=Nezara viridula TaxID=85310 RepID=A0A9P0EE08_NEZVI|nr:unnamed protein product [Nezara viridula]